ncbi:carbon-nitrogen hydrolase family protein [Allokutzneria sp. A3M-2-11 16]|uniref:carbon-nitrogen hydrolase family protein n=1 Tax=Allokutzneria sp. A3M-2-11 16 TaxID=2962043 RepID=UPI0020B78935|nr:carbon-nitrogen hydrolase family protein [Allokutzneria sp. A3M-2-11 16]MCP3804684.1 carbon-nitrogen hydrolase family protein [Allokutzneria sp. A3M-2-11 16]
MRIACWQATARRTDVPAALRALRARAGEAAEAGASLLVTPEMSLTGYHIGARRLRQLAEPADGPMCQAVSEIASANGIAIVHGWPELSGGGVYNSARLVDSSGEESATYRKAHLFGDIDRNAFSPGDTGLVRAELGGVPVGIIICYDVEFPESVRAHAVAGTRLLLVPTALMSPWDFVAETLVPARAFESQLFLAYTNWVGSERELSYCGLTRVVGPDGRVVAGRRDGEGLVLADLDLSLVDRARAETTYLADRRPELYS